MITNERRQWYLGQIARFMESHPGVDYCIGHLIFADDNIDISSIDYSLSAPNIKLWVGDRIEEYEKEQKTIEELQSYLKLTSESIQFLYLLKYEMMKDGIEEIEV